MKALINPNRIIVGDFNIPHTENIRSSRHENQQRHLRIKHIIDKMDFTEYSTQKNTHLLSILQNLLQN
jgi:hypothetical protein